MIRRAIAQDAKRLTRLIQRSSAYQGGYASIIEGYRVGPDYIEHHRVFAASDDTGRVLGFYALVLDPPELDLAFVANDAQGLGIGRELITHMLGEARSAGLTEVRVISHPPAEPFYRRMGAEPVGTVPPKPPAVGWERPELRWVIT
jgi:GNAT superfamily N-acetyltransferase